MAIVSLSRILASWAEKQPNNTAIAHDDDSISWAELEKRTNQLARAYMNLGVKEGDLVTIALPNGIEFVSAVFATWKLGATPQPISSKLPKIERDAIIELASSSLVVGVDTADVGENFISVPENYAGYEQQSAEPLEERTAEKIKAMTSGGSTGRPKLIVAPTPAVWDDEASAFMIPHQSRVLVPGPLYHNGPFLWTLASLCQGNRVVIVTRFDAEQTLQLIEEHQVEHMYAVPTMMQRIWNLAEDSRSRYDLSSLKSLLHTAAPCPVWLKEAFIGWLGASVIWELYGGTEGQGATLINGEEWLEHKGSVGKPMDGVCSMKILAENGQELPPGEIGEIYIKSTVDGNATYEYIGAESNVIDDGWDSLGDMGYMDDDGYLYLADRRTDLIICGGANIYPAEVEAAVEALSGVRSCAVIGLPHEDLGNQVHAIVDAPAGNISEETLLAFLQNQLVRYKLPRSVEFVTVPLRDDAGKVRRKALREARLQRSTVSA
ncbi:AMP-binding protein [Pseudomaricurvus alkylphenolicus]|uniref:AMP-binding protein n=1 Tax=Pseudomaricurvus alkylphenolicus TaxID=1306991 RepID=UPI001423B578|nr:AMP-binding protein [Pseudomaricurvus alkylphenolicus]NIB42431.1 AMP-binding protein [Pseudomaricurvus alkylphenolicus]